MPRYKMYARTRGDGDMPEACEFQDAELTLRHIVRAPDGSITQNEALLIVNDWNRASANQGLDWRYWIA